MKTRNMTIDTVKVIVIACIAPLFTLTDGLLWITRVMLHLLIMTLGLLLKMTQWAAVWMEEIKGLATMETSLWVTETRQRINAFAVSSTAR